MSSHKYEESHKSEKYRQRGENARPTTEDPPLITISRPSHRWSRAFTCAHRAALFMLGKPFSEYRFKVGERKYVATEADENIDHFEKSLRRMMES